MDADLKQIPAPNRDDNLDWKIGCILLVACWAPTRRGLALAAALGAGVAAASPLFACCCSAGASAANTAEEGDAHGHHRHVAAGHDVEPGPRGELVGVDGRRLREPRPPWGCVDCGRRRGPCAARSRVAAAVGAPIAGDRGPGPARAWVAGGPNAGCGCPYAGCGRLRGSCAG